MMTELDRIVLTVMAYTFAFAFVASGLDLIKRILLDKQTFSWTRITVMLLFPSLFNAVVFGFIIGCAYGYNLYFRGRI